MSRIKIERQPCSHDDHQVHIELPGDYHDLAHSADDIVREFVAPYPRARRLYDALLDDPRVNAHWDLANYTAVMKMGYNDHGPVHAQVATAGAMQIAAALVQADVPLDVVASGAGGMDDAMLVILAGAMLHDIGNQLHRSNHVAYGVILTQPILERLLPAIYPDPEQHQLIQSFILSTIATHDCDPPPLTIEGGIVAVADGTDMTKGRGRMSFDLGRIDIHSVSALSIEEVHIRRGKRTAVDIEVVMSNSAGIFQVQETLVRKLLKTPLKNHVTVRACTTPADKLIDQRIVHCVALQDGYLQVDENG
jgi:hypothetical protein